MKKIPILFLLLCGTVQHLSAQVLETEESYPLQPGQVELGTGLEFQTSKEGTESALPLSLEFGLAKRLTFLVEPVSFTSIRPKAGRGVTGLGDLELTMFYQLCKEKEILPSISLSLEVKLPVAKDTLIGTGKTDFSPYLIMSKTTGKFFSSLNLSYTFLGKPAGVVANNLFNYALGTIYSVSKRSILYGEVYGNTSAFGGHDVPESNTALPKTTEISGGEIVTAIGYGFYLKPEFLLSFGINHDNNRAFLFRPGIEWKFGGKKINTAKAK